MEKLLGALLDTLNISFCIGFESKEAQVDNFDEINLNE